MRAPWRAVFVVDVPAGEAQPQEPRISLLPAPASIVWRAYVPTIEHLVPKLLGRGASPIG